MIKPCFQCNQNVEISVQVTDILDDGTIRTRYFCRQCRGDQLNHEIADFSKITTAEELLVFLTDLKSNACSCGTNETEFDKIGKFGCPQCYVHFKNKMEEIVFLFHKAKEHVGKRPKTDRIELLMQDPVEKQKILKLRYAKALELEKYEEAAELRKQMD